VTWLLNVLGALLVLTALRDVFHTLWHPRGFGSLGRHVFRLVWRIASRGRPTELGGPLGLLTVVVVWTGLVVAGWTLVYLPHMPESFSFGGALQPGESSDLVTSAYLSLVTVGTLGFGDIVPATAPLRLVVPLQALVGFLLFTAAISWVLQVYPALTRRRSLAKRLHVMAENDAVSFVGTGSPAVVAQLLQSLVEDLLTVSSDFLQYGSSYYFREGDRTQSLAANLPFALDLVAAGERSPSPDVRHLTALLRDAVAGTAATLEEYVGPRGSPTAVLDAFAEDHGHEPVRA
jgi:hypothetical protein